MEKEHSYAYNDLVKMVKAVGYEKKDEYSNKTMEEIYDWERDEVEDIIWEKFQRDKDSMLSDLLVKLKKYDADYIFEFDTLDELREFDESYVRDTRSSILKDIAESLGVNEAELKDFQAIKALDNRATGFKFVCKGKGYTYEYGSDKFI